MIIHRAIDSPIRKNLTWEEKWRGDDGGLIIAWEVGRWQAMREPELAERALRGELVQLGWKGGVEKKLKIEKFGTLLYLATWQGLRGEDLDVDTEQERSLTCTRFDMTVTFTAALEKFAEP